MLTVIIPAYNESSCIIPTLTHYKALASQDVQVIVVPNGCIDNTAELVRDNFEKMVVLELKNGSKIAAINEGLKVAKYPHVLIQDADVEIDEHSLRTMVDFIKSESYLFASPVTNLSISGSFWIRRYYDFLMITPAFQKGMVNSGAYLLSPEACEKLGIFPQVIADDGYVKGVLNPNNLVKIADCYSLVKTPTDLWSLIKIKTRSKLGNMQLASIRKSPIAGDNGLLKLLKLGIKHNSLLSCLIYISVTFTTILRAKYQLKFGRPTFWERDESTRN